IPVGEARADNMQDLRARGTRLLVLNEAGTSWQLKIDLGTLIGGDRHPAAIVVDGPSGRELLHPDMIRNGDGVHIERPTQEAVGEFTWTIPADGPGLYSVYIDSYRIGLFQSPLTTLPYAALLRNTHSTQAHEDIIHVFRSTFGYIDPLYNKPLV